jgi:sulfonate transport system ATP-binding protein
MIEIDIARVSKAFTTTRGVTAALHELNLTIARGELVCLVGPSGCGKTTLLNLVAGLERPDAGAVRVGGRAVDGPGPDRGVMFQEAALFPWLTVGGNVAFGLREQRVPAAERERRVLRWIDRVGMTRFVRANVHELSGGMRQRVALARALALEPEILLMDEPFGALDARSREQLQRMLVEIWRATAKTIVFVTHDMAEAVRLGSRVIVLAARPARVQRSVELEALLPRPRTVEQRAVVELAAHLKAGLDDTDEMEQADAADDDDAATAAAHRAFAEPLAGARAGRGADHGVEPRR